MKTKRRPPRTMDGAGFLNTWCAWDQQWEQTLRCAHCGTELPACYVTAHIYYACVGHPKSKSEVESSI
jgi:hypothetical protein